MRVCLLGEYNENLDEGMRKVSYHFAEELTKRHQVLTLDLRNVFTKTFWRDIKVFNPEIIHCIQGPSVKLFILLKIISVYCRDAKTILSATMHPGFSFLSKRFIPLFTPDMILVQSDDAEKIFKKKGCETDFLPYGVDVKRFKPVTTGAKERLKEKYGIEKKEFVILHVGSIKYGRNVQSLEKLQKGNNQVLIVGPISAGIHLRVYQQLIEVGCLVWRKYIENIEEIYALSDCYVFPVVLKKNSMEMTSADSIEMPLSVLEAMSCNLPIISTRFGALPRVFEEGNGLVFVDEEDDFIAALEKIKNYNIDIETREKVLPYSWDSIGKKLEEIYSKLMGETNEN